VLRGVSSCDPRGARSAALVTAVLLLVASNAEAIVTARAPTGWSWNWESDDQAVPEQVFRQLFAFKLRTYPRIAGINFDVENGNDHFIASDMPFVETTLRGKLALIPPMRSRQIRLSANLSAVAFPIYLCETCKNGVPQSMLVPPDAKPGADAAKEAVGKKLLQFLFYAPAANRLLGKPEGYPLELSHWDRRAPEGDWTSVFEVISLGGVRGCDFCVELHSMMEENGTVLPFLQVLAYQRQGISASARFVAGELAFPAHRGDPRVVVTYDQIRREGSNIVARKVTESNLQTAMSGVPPGDHVTDVVLFSLFEDAGQ
jgi:hypothetical protein